MRDLRNRILILLIISLLLSILQISSKKHLDFLKYKGLVFTEAKHSNGNSTANIISKEPSLIYECELKKDLYQWPYCEYDFITIADINNKKYYKSGLNLTNYENLLIDIEMLYEGKPIKQTPLRIYLKHYEAQLPEAIALKINQVEFDSFIHPNGIIVPLDYLQVADWWRNDHNIDTIMSYRDISNIIQIGVATPANAEMGKYTFKINKLSVEGKWLSNDIFYPVLLAIWLLLASYHVIKSFYLTHNKNKKLIERNKQLHVSNKKYKVLASYDALTGCLNRNGYEEIIFNFLHSCNKEAAILFMDIDNFKLLNDTYGHDIGDQVLQKFCYLIRSRNKANQHLVRWGGEEFLLFCGDIDVTQAVEIGKLIQSTMKQHQWSHGEIVTCSIGIAIWNKHQSIEECINKADSALYRAKTSGKDKVEVA